MQFPIVQQYKLDITGENPDNQINDEPIELVGNKYNGLIVIPRHAPFFVDSLELKFENGQPLVLDKDYEIYRLMGKLTEEAGQPVASLIKIRTTNVAKVIASYKTAGEFSLIDNSVLQLLMSAADDDRPVWWENLRDKPTSFTPIWHSHSILYEVMAFQDVIDLIKDIVKMINDKPEDPLLANITQKTELIKSYITLYGNALKEQLTNHENSHNAHGITAKQVNLEKVDNFPSYNEDTQDQPSLESHLTVSGLRRIIDEFEFVGAEYQAAKNINISSWGSNDGVFLPPLIGGSMESVGTTNEQAVFCEEENGEIVILQNGSSVFTGGELFYYRLGKRDSYKYETTYLRYTHPFVSGEGATVNRVVNGGGDEVMIVGDSRTNKIFAVSTNGTLNSDRHQMSLLNINIPGFDVNVGFDNICMTVLGKWVYLFYQDPVASEPLYDTSKNPLVPPDFAKTNVRTVRKFKKSDIGTLKTISDAPAYLSYDTLDGTYFNNTSIFKWVSVFNNFKCHLKFSPPLESGGLVYSQNVISVKHPTDPDKYIIKMLTGCLFYNEDVFNNLFEVSYEINPNTGHMSLISGTEGRTINPNDSSSWEGFYQDHSYLIFSDKELYIGDEIRIGDRPRSQVSRVMSRANSTVFVTSWGDVLSLTISKIVFPRRLYINKGFRNVSKDAVLSKVWTKELPGGVKNKYDDFKKNNNLTWVDFDTSPFERGGGKIQVLDTLIGSSFEIAGVIDDSEPEGFSLWKKDIASKNLITDPSNNFLNTGEFKTIDTDGVYKKLNLPPEFRVLGRAIQKSSYPTTIEQVVSFKSGTQASVLDRSGNNSGLRQPTDPDEIVLIDDFNFKNELDDTVTVLAVKETVVPGNVVRNYINGEFGSVKNDYKEIEMTVEINIDSEVVVTVIGLKKNHKEVFFSQYICTGVFSPYSNGVRQLSSISKSIRTAVLRYPIRKNKTITYPHPRFSARNYPLSSGSGYTSYYNYYSTTGFMVKSEATMGHVSTGFYISYKHDGRDTLTNKALRYHGLSIFPRGLVSSYRYDGVSAVYLEQMENGCCGPWGVTSQVGKVKYSNNNVFLNNNWLLTLSDSSPVFLGYPHHMAGETVDLRNVTPNPSNKTFYIYVELVNNIPRYNVIMQKRKDTLTRLFIGVVVTNVKQILTVYYSSVFLFNGLRLTAVKSGGSLPYSTGGINDVGNIPWINQTI